MMVSRIWCQIAIEKFVLQNSAIHLQRNSVRFGCYDADLVGNNGRNTPGKDMSALSYWESITLPTSDSRRILSALEAMQISCVPIGNRHRCFYYRSTKGRLKIKHYHRLPPFRHINIFQLQALYAYGSIYSPVSGKEAVY